MKKVLIMISAPLVFIACAVILSVAIVFFGGGDAIERIGKGIHFVGRQIGKIGDSMLDFTKID